MAAARPLVHGGGGAAGEEHIAAAPETEKTLHPFFNEESSAIIPGMPIAIRIGVDTPHRTRDAAEASRNDEAQA